jgi:LysM repeat protein
VNRENKLALIIGFTLILVVGVLISDHLSRAQSERLDPEPGASGVTLTSASMPANALADQQAIAMATPPPVLVDRPVRVPRADEFLSHAGLAPSVPGSERIAAVDAMLGPAGVGGPAGLMGFEPVGPDGAAPVALAEAQPPAASAGADPGAGDAEDAPVTLADAADSLWSRWQSSATRPLVQTTQPTRSGSAARSSRTADPQAELSPRSAGTITPGVTHTVKPGESLFEIAKKYLGNGGRWREIRDANRGRIAENGSVRSGVTITIPGARASAATPAPRTAAASGGGSKPPAKAAKETGKPAAGATAKPAAVTYTVRSGDTLAGIARRMLGSADRAGEILRANRGVVTDPDKITVGMKLTIPKR